MPSDLPQWLETAWQRLRAPLGFGDGSAEPTIQLSLRELLADARTSFGGQAEAKGLKLLVDNWIDLAAGRAYAEQTALTIDEGDKDLATEGSIAKKDSRTVPGAGNVGKPVGVDVAGFQRVAHRTAGGGPGVD